MAYYKIVDFLGSEGFVESDTPPSVEGSSVIEVSRSDYLKLKSSLEEQEISDRFIPEEMCGDIIE